ncbi:MAG TPA: hypothetical protein PK668_27280 [Myxococcota bacterium]|nr:hypothetical protein [Myxococcota bacterium]HRY97230.1 hypothetical protein [Myxococcota bacterium]HSA20665.1 hypothetical protein [Myxococcota bacterium]
MKPSLRAIVVVLAAGLLLVQTASAQDTAEAKKQIGFLDRGLAERVKSIRELLRQRKMDTATLQIRGVTEVLEQMARLAREVQKSEPGYSPGLSLDLDDSPALARLSEFKEAKKLALAAAKALNKDCQAASDALLKAKNRQLATIAISALKFTVENAPGRPGGELTEFVVEGAKRLNGYLMDKYIAEPITGGLSEVKLLKDNFVSIADGAKLLKGCEASREKVMAVARAMDAEVKAAQGAAEAEKAWQAFRWMQAAGRARFRVQVVDVSLRALKLTLGGAEVTAGMKGQTLELEAPVVLTARVQDARRQFCLDKRAYAAKTKTIVLEPGPGGGPEDSLVYHSTQGNARSAWLIQEERFDWKPSANSALEDDPRASSGAYWKLEKGRVRWTPRAKPGEQVNVFVKGTLKWRQDQVLPGGKKSQEETNDGSATLVLKLL